jgi:hypothetical protein
MPLETSNIVNILGISTEGSIFDPQQTPPNSLYDCKNITFYKYGQASARKGQAIWFDQTQNSINYPQTSIHAKSSFDFSGFFVTYTPDTTSSRVATINSSGTLLLANAAVKFVLAPNSVGIRSSSSASGSQIDPAPTNYQVLWGSSNQNSLAMFPNGLYRTCGPTNSQNTLIKKAQISKINSFTASFLSATGSYADVQWFKSGYVTKLKAVIETYYPETGGFYQSPTLQATYNSSSGYFSDSIVNLSADGGISINLNLDTTNILDLNWSVLKIYRTLQYKLGTTAEVDYHLCYETTLVPNSPTITYDNYGIATITNLILKANDDFIRSSETIYTDTNNDGGLGEAITSPYAEDFVNYKGYITYGGIKRSPYVNLAQISVEDQPSIYFSLGTTSTSLNPLLLPTTSLVNSLTPPPTTGLLGDANLNTLTFKGSAGAYYPLRIRVYANPTDKNVIPFYAVASKIETTSNSGSAVIKITPASNSAFDATRFSSPGIMAIVGSDGYTVVDIIQYRDFEQVSQEGKINFFDASFIRNNGTAFTALTGTFFVFFLQGSSINNLPIYPISYDDNGTLKAFSLLPTYYTYPTKKFMDTPVGWVSSLSWDAVNSRVQCYPTFSGILWRDEAAKLKAAVFNLSSQINTLSGFVSIYQPPFNMIIASTYAGTHNTTFANNGNYDSLFFGLTSGGSSKFSEALTVSPTDFSEKTYLPNSLIFSKLNRPEEIALASFLDPVKIGSEDNKILRLAVNNDQLYVFKEYDGIFRVEITEGTSSPQLSTIAVVDNTVQLIAKYSLQEFNESIYFLSNKGVLQLNNGQFTNLSRTIETQIKTAFLAETDPLKIVSFSNEYRKIYGIRFPTSNKTYILDTLTGQWSIWDTQFNAAFVEPSGKQYFAQTVPTPSPSYIIRRDTPGDITNLSGQYDEVIPLTGSTITYNPSTLIITISRTGTSSIYQNIFNLSYSRFSGLATSDINSSNGDFVYIDQSGTLTRLLYNSSLSSSGTLSFTAIEALPATPTTTDSLIVGVNSSVSFNRFFITGSLNLNQFSESHLHIINRVDDVGINFECDSETPTFNTPLITTDGTYELIRVLIPRDQARGQWIQARVRHSKPYERFILGGIGWVYRNVSSFRTKVKNV